MNDNTTGEPGAVVPGTGDNQPAAGQTTAPTGVAAADIAARLGKTGGEKGGEAGGEKIIPENPLPFDVTKLSPDQLATLKAMLQATPDRQTMKAAKPLVRVRMLNEKIVVDHGNAKNTLVKNAETGFTEEVIVIPVKFLGDTEFTKVLWKDFMYADQISCEVIGTRYEDDSYSEGTVQSRETGREVERKVTVRKDFFTIKLPEGTKPGTVEIEARVANA